jgi:hypothetical protein
MPTKLWNNVQPTASTFETPPFIKPPALLGKEVSMSDRISIEGKLLWDETDQPVAGVTVQLCTDDGTVIGTAKSDEEGRYRSSIPSERPIHIIVADQDGRVFHSTRDAAVALEGSSCKIDSIIPGGPGGPEAAALVTGPRDLASIARDATDPEALLQIARTLLSPERLTGAEALAIKAVETSLCGTSVLEAIEETIRKKGWPREIAHQLDDILAMRDTAFASATYQSPNFSVTYQTSGTGAVSSSTATETVTDPGTSNSLGSIGDGTTPTYILRICFWLERALAAYVAPPFSMKNPASGGKIPVVINTAPYGAASPSGTMYMNCKLPADLICAVGVHELFHLVQFRYGGKTGPWRQSVIEGGAVFAEDSAADKMNRYLDEAGSNFNGTGTQANPNLSLMSAGYKCCLFWRYVAEQQSADITEPYVGVETYRKVIEYCSAGDYSTNDVKKALRELPWYQDFYEFSYLDPQRLDLTNSETALGNYALACYLKDLGANVPDTRFDFIEDEENIYIDEVVGGPPGTTLASPKLTGTGMLGTAGSVAFTGSVNSFAHRFYEIPIDQAVKSVQATFTAGAGLTSLVFQVGLIDEDGKVRDVHRTDMTSYSKRVANLVNGKRLSKVVAVVTGASTGGSFSLSLTPAAPAPNVMITRWHSVMGTEYEINSRNWAWTWVSPDVWVDNDNDGVADGTVYLNTDNKLHIRLHNKGNADANGIQIEAFYQDAAPGLSPTAWQPVKNVAGVTQVLSGLSLTADSSRDWVMNWAPKPSGTSEHFCVRVVVTVLGDPNTDNKRCVSNFGSVKVKPNQVKDIKGIMERIRQKFPLGRVHIVPRLGPRRDIVISQRDIKDLQLGRLDAVSTLRISHVPVTLSTEGLPQPGQQWRAPSVPDHVRNYLTDEKALPPGVAEKPMVTIAAVDRGIVQGGVTLMIEVED